MFFNNIHKLVNNGDILKVEKFISKKPSSINQEESSTGAIPLNIAIKNADIPMYNFLLSKGAAIDERSLYFAITSKNVELVESIIKQGGKLTSANIFSTYNYESEKEIHEQYCKSLIDLILKYKFKLDDDLKFNILRQAYINSTQNVINYLSENDFKPIYNSKILHEAIGNYGVSDDNFKTAELVKTIIQENPKLINQIYSDKDNNSHTPLQDTIRSLIFRRAMGEIKTIEKYEEIAYILISAGADVNIVSSQTTPFFDYLWSTFMRDGKIDSSNELIKLFLSKSTNKMANILYKELSEKKPSKAVLLCKVCKQSFILEINYYQIKNKYNDVVSIICPHCKSSYTSWTYLKFADEEDWIKMEKDL